MKIIDLHERVFGPLGLCTIREIEQNLTLIDVVTSLSGGAINTLRAAFKAGPLDDGDVPSKAGRDELVSLGLMVKVIIKGDWGYNACTYKGAYAVRVLDEKVAGESVARHHQPLDKALPG